MHRLPLGHLTSIAVIALILIFPIAGKTDERTWVKPRQRLFGPLECKRCRLPWPSVTSDHRTENLLNKKAKDSRLVPTDLVTVCNQTSCVKYEYSSSHQWIGIDERAQDDDAATPERRRPIAIRAKKKGLRARSHASLSIKWCR